MVVGVENLLQSSRYSENQMLSSWTSSGPLRCPLRLAEREFTQLHRRHFILGIWIILDEVTWV